MRPIGVGVPSGKVKMTLWQGTEDEQSFEVKRLKAKNHMYSHTEQNTT